MGFFKKKPIEKTATGPYRNPALNQVYELLFCDNLDLYRTGDAKDRYP